jgi:hypothetical protein
VPFTLQPDDEARLLRVVAEGTIDREDCLRAIRATATELAGTGWGGLADLRALEYIPSVADLRLFAIEFARLRGAFAGGIALVVSNDVHYGLGRLLAALTEQRGIRIGVARSVDEGEAWLRALA